MVKTNEKKSIFFYIGKTISAIITIILIFLAVIIVFQRVFNKSFMGYSMYIVATGSMIPEYEIGAVVFVHEKDVNDIQVGDDLVYEGKSGNVKDKTITHRVIEIEEEDGKRYFHTKGIANTIEDPLVSEDQIKGVVIYKMLIVTWICSLAQNKFTIYFLIVLPITLFIFFKIIHVDIRKER